MYTDLFKGVDSKNLLVEKIESLKSLKVPSPTIEESAKIMHDYIENIPEPYIGVFANDWFSTGVENILKLVKLSPHMIDKLIESNPSSWFLSMLWKVLNDKDMDYFIEKHCNSKHELIRGHIYNMSCLRANSLEEYVRRIPSTVILQYLLSKDYRMRYEPGIACYLNQKDHDIWYKKMRTMALLYLIKKSFNILVGLTELDLPALVTYEILYQGIPACRDAIMYDVWKMITMVKHRR